VRLFQERASRTRFKKTRPLSFSRTLLKRGTRMLDVERQIELFLHSNQSICFLGNVLLEKLKGVKYSR
jgi:hypothetical protein